MYRYRCAPTAQAWGSGGWQHLILGGAEGGAWAGEVQEQEGRGKESKGGGRGITAGAEGLRERQGTLGGKEVLQRQL